MIRNPVTIAPLVEEDIVAVQALTVKPFQEIFAGPSVDLLAGPEAGFSVHVIKKQGTVVGMFRVDTRFHFGLAFALADTPGIRSFIIDKNKQGQGLGTEASRMMPSYLRGIIPMARGVYMLVNVNNQGAYKSCFSGGWADTGEKYTLGHTGPQHILWMPLR
ncbi:GNAT family N-acetyltransferase [Paraglaciecola arctica]|uniref:N-acetyltransferase domain-containing protein n=1 Tax=Paraglaciecola arctica BSs20135 TaxID=493475 RepID=K6YU52_9ALTE|nr:GNAT family N-acetyltransferase [Paraglaciecola arctica]GAC21702.1 hypothetical protein GARC_4765 [Paraglaciecola arctica BSs20135]